MSGLAGLTAIGSAAVAPASGLLIAAISWPLTIYVGYRIWNAGHPATSVWRELGRRAVAVAGFIATLVAILLVQAFPQVVIAILGLRLAAIVMLVVALAIASRGIKMGVRACQGTADKLSYVCGAETWPIDWHIEVRARRLTRPVTRGPRVSSH